MSDTTSRRLADALADRYAIERELGQGGMATVYLAHDLKHRRRVAVKVLRPELSAALGAERFLREIETTANLRHPHILPLYDSGEAGGFLFYVMPLVEGESLRDTLRREKRLPVEAALRIAREVADALSYAHERGVIHRDIKPENILLESGHAVVADFGIAKAMSTLTDGRLTQTGLAIGTPAYMSPEQALADTALDGRSDLYSLGCVLFEMLAGEVPFAAATPQRTIARRLTEPPPAVAELRTDVGAQLSGLIQQALAPDPADRPQTTTAFAGLLAAVGNHSLASPPGPGASSPASGSAPSNDSGPAGGDEGFRVAVLPFKYAGVDASLTGLAEGLTEEIVTGLSRFSYLRVISRSGKPLGARYVMEGSLRQAGTKLRLAVQLVDAVSGAHLWAENYERTFSPEAVFELQDDLVPRIVSTVADQNGILTRRMSEALRSKSEDVLTPHEALLRAFSYFQRVTPEEHAVVRRTLERATREAPDYADCWAMLSLMYAVEFSDDFNLGPHPLDRSLAAAQRAVHLAATHALGHYALAFVYFLRKETVSFRAAAEQALALNPMDGSVMGILGLLIEHAGESERGCRIVETAMQLNPNYSALFRWPAFVNAYDQRKYPEALELAVRINLPNYFYAYAARAAVLGQLGQREAAEKELRELLALRPDFATAARREFTKWYDSERVEHLIEGLRKAGLDVSGSRATNAPSSAGPRDSAVAIAVLPFSDLSSAKDQDYICEGMAEEIMHALVRIDGIRVASRTSAFRARQDNGDLRAIARALSVNHVLEGSVRTAGSRLRVTAQLTDVASGYQLWSERFDREASDIFAVQDEIAAGVVDAVKIRLASGPHPVPARPQVRNLEAYRSYLKGRHLRYAKEDHGGAIRAFEEAIRLDPTHAPSWTGLAESMMLAASFAAIPAREACAAARRALASAVGLEGETADGLHGEGWLALIERRWPAMEVAWRRAIKLQPTHALALGSFGISLCMGPKFDEGLRFLERAREVDPLASFPYMLTGYAVLCGGRIEEAHRYAEQALSFEKEDASARLLLGVVQVALGRFDEGIATAEHLVLVTHRAPIFVGLLGWALATAGRKDEARPLLVELRARPATAPTIVTEGQLLGALGDLDAAFEVLAKAEEEGQLFLYFHGWPTFDPLRGDPRFPALVARLGLSGGPR